MVGEKQIFVFDESHNISKKAQDLLLKEVEDSPGHNYFIFFSTEPSGMLETLRIRCEPHEFREMPSADLKKTLKKSRIPTGFYQSRIGRNQNYLKRL